MAKKSKSNRPIQPYIASDEWINAHINKRKEQQEALEKIIANIKAPTTLPDSKHLLSKEAVQKSVKRPPD